MPACRSIVIKNLSSKTTRDGITLKLEHPEIAGRKSVKDVNFTEGDKFAIVHFHNETVVRAILDKKIKLDESYWTIQPYYTNFAPAGMDDLLKTGKTQERLEIDEDIMEFLQNHKNFNFDSAIPSDKYSLLKNTDEAFISIAENFRELFLTFYNQCRKVKVDIDASIADNLSSELENEFRRLQSSSENWNIKLGDHLVVIVGLKESVEVAKAIVLGNLKKLKERISITKPSPTLLPLSQEKIALLDLDDSLNEIRKAFDVNLKIKSDGIEILGEERKLEKAKHILMRKIVFMSERLIDLSKGVSKLFSSSAGMDRVAKFLENQGIKVVLKVKNNKLSILALSSTDANTAATKLESALQDVIIRLTDTEKQLFNTYRGKMFLNDLQKEMPLLVEIHSSELVISGIDTENSKGREDINRFLNDNKIEVDIIPAKNGLIRFLLECGQDKLKGVEGSLADKLVTVEKGSEQFMLEVKGCKSGLDDAINNVKKIINSVRSGGITIQKPGVRKLFKKSLTKDALCGLEKELNIVVINQEDDAEDISEVLETNATRNIGPTELVCHVTMKKNKKLSVYCGDITKEHVDIIVNPSNNQLWMGGGVAGAILSAGGNIIQDECNQHVAKYGLLTDCEVVLTGAGRLSCKNIVHVAGPRWPSPSVCISAKELDHKLENAKGLLQQAIKNILINSYQYSSVALPAVSSGIFGFPKEICAKIILSTASNFLRNNPTSRIRDIHFINNDKETTKIFAKEFQTMFQYSADFVKVSDEYFKKDQEANETTSLSDTASIVPRLRGHKDLYAQGTASSSRWERLIEDSERTSVPKIERKTDSQVHATQRDSFKGDDSHTMSTPGTIRIELVVGDISEQKVDVIVNSASSTLNLSSNPCAKSLSIAAGPSLQKDCNALVQQHGGKLGFWSISITNGGNLHCKLVFHAVCEQYDGAGGSEKKLEDFVDKILKKASICNMSSIALPALGTGVLGFPKDKAAQILLESVQAFSNQVSNTSLKNVKLVAYNSDSEMVDAFRHVFTRSKSIGTIGIHHADKGQLLVGSVCVILIKGEITTESTDGVVVIGDQNLSFSGKVGQAVVGKESDIFRSLTEYHKPQKLGTTVIIKSTTLKAKNVVHVVPATSRRPKYDDLLQASYQMFLDVDRSGLGSVSVPAIGSGGFGLSPNQSANLILQSLTKAYAASKNFKSLKTVRIVIFQDHMYEIFRQEMMKLKRWSLSDEKNRLIVPLSSANADRMHNTHLIHEDNVGSPAEYALVRESITLVIYSFQDRNITNAKKRIEALVDENITTITTTKAALANLSRKRKNSLNAYATKLDVEVTVENDGNVTIVGCHQDTTKVLEYCHEIALEAVSESKGNVLDFAA